MISNNDLYDLCRLEIFPEAIYKIPKLEVLILKDNKIKTIDAKQLKEMTGLLTLDLSNNDLDRIPPELGLCSQFRLLFKQFNLVNDTII